MMMFTLVQQLDALRLLKVPPLTLVTYLTLLECHYRPHNSYHNSIHAADVVQSAFVLLNHAALQVTEDTTGASCSRFWTSSRQNTACRAIAPPLVRCSAKGGECDIRAVM